MKKTNNAFLVLISFVAALGGLLFGFDIAIITGAIPFIKPHFGLSELQLGWGVSSLLVGCIFGAAIAGRITDVYGRKRILLIVAVLFAVTCVGTGIAPSFNLFVAARLLGGLAVGAASMISPMYISEIAPFKIRGKLVSFYQFSIVLGILIGWGVAKGFDLEFSTPWVAMIWATSIAFIVAVVSGLYPATKAAKLDPIESLRYE